MENCTRRIVHSVIFVRVCLFVCVARPSAGFQSANMDGSQMDVCAWVCCAPISISSKSINQLLHQKPCTCTTSFCTVYQIIFPPDAFYTRCLFLARYLLHQTLLVIRYPFHRRVFALNNNYTKQLLHKKPFTTDTAYQTALHQKPLIVLETFTPHPFSTRSPWPQLLRQTAHQRSFRPKTFLHQKTFAAKPPSTPNHFCTSRQTDFTLEDFYTGDLWHQTSFAPNSFYTRRRLRQIALAPNSPYAKQLSEHKAFTRRVLHGRLSANNSYTPHFIALLHQTTLTPNNPNSFYTRRLLHQTTLALKISDTAQLLHQTSLGQCLAHHCAVWSFHVLLG